MDPAACLNQRVVLTCKNTLSYAGLMRQLTSTGSHGPAVQVELDEESGFSILCPLSFVEKITVVPIHPE